MKLSAADLFVCPVSKEPLTPHAFSETSLDLSNEQAAKAAQLGMDISKVSRVIREGALVCEESRTWYPIINGMPVLLDFSTETHRAFRDRHAPSTDIFSRYEMPGGKPRPGEEATQRSFTKEWDALEIDDPSFGLTPEQRDTFISLELDWPTGLRSKRPLDVLEVGCGSGFESKSLERVTGGHIIGVDLNFSLLARGPDIDKHPFIDLAVASLFALPARERSFDLVYSSGVLHHTYSTELAFNQIERYRKPEGAIYLWVYAIEDSARTKYMRAEWSWEEIVRPRIAILSDRLQNLVVAAGAHYMTWWYKRNGAYSRSLWTHRNSEHAVRDKWTPLFAHRHSFHEVTTWFLKCGLDTKLVNPLAYRERMGSSLIGIGIRGAPLSTSRCSHSQGMDCE